MDRIVCKFRFNETMMNRAGTLAEVNGYPITGSGGTESERMENESFSKWTPSGQIKLSITNPAAIPFFDGDEPVYVILTKESPFK